MFFALSGISLSWKTLVFGRFVSQERTNVHRMAFFLHAPDFSLSKVTALKVVWGKDTSRRSKEPESDLPPCFSAWAQFCKCGWRHHLSRSGCGPDWGNTWKPPQGGTLCYYYVAQNGGIGTHILVLNLSGNAIRENCWGRMTFYDDDKDNVCVSNLFVENFWNRFWPWELGFENCWE